jgi:branched-chain amino acid transport system substrate-binding protein
MKKTTRALKYLGIGLAAMLASHGALSADKIKIGSFLSVTGGASFIGDPELRTLQLYIDEINAQGGWKGKPVELVHYDSGSKAKTAVKFAKRLVQKDRVDVIIGGSTSGNTLAVMPIIEKAKVPFISLAASVKIIEPTQKWVFKTAHTDRMAAERLFQDMKANGISKIALISGDGGFDRSGRAQCLKLAPKYGIDIVIDESYGNGDTDMTAQLSKVRGSEAQAVLNFGFARAPAIVTKNMRQLQIDLPLYHSHGVASKTFLELAGDAAEGVRFPAASLIVADQLPDNDPQKKVLLSYRDKFESQGQKVSTFGGHAYDALFMALEAIDRAGSTDKMKVREELEKTVGFTGTGGVFNFGADDHLGLGVEAFRMVEVRNGDWKLLN